LRLRVGFTNAAQANSDGERGNHRVAPEYPPLLLFV
jgi:hypothetical protein